jgi:hypothetical protein
VEAINEAIHIRGLKKLLEMRQRQTPALCPNHISEPIPTWRRVMTIPEPVLSWLLEENGPSIQSSHRLQTSDRPETDPEVTARKPAIPGSTTAAKVLR